MVYYPSGDSNGNSELLERERLVTGVCPPSGTCSEVEFEALCAWQYATPVRRSGSWQRLAARVPRQAILLLQLGVVDFIECSTRLLVIALKVGLLVFLELWLRIGVKHVVFLELWLEIAYLELWLGMADEHEEPLSCGSDWRVLLM